MVSEGAPEYDTIGSTKPGVFWEMVKMSLSQAFIEENIPDETV